MNSPLSRVALPEVGFPPFSRVFSKTLFSCQYFKTASSLSAIFDFFVFSSVIQKLIKMPELNHSSILQTLSELRDKPVFALNYPDCAPLPEEPTRYLPRRQRKRGCSNKNTSTRRPQ